MVRGISGKRRGVKQKIIEAIQKPAIRTERHLKRLERAREKHRDIQKRIETIFPEPEKISTLTRLYAFYWARKPRLGLLKGKKPIITNDLRIFYKWFIAKMARKIMKKKHKGPIIALIGGISASGKTTISRRLALLSRALFADNLKAEFVSLDDYFKERVITEKKDRKGNIAESRKRIGGKNIEGEFDNPRASRLGLVKKKLASLRNGGTEEFITTNPKLNSGEENYKEKKQLNWKNCDLLIVEGLYPLERSFARLGDIRVGVITSLPEQFEHRMERDTASPPKGRGKSKMHVIHRLVSRSWFQKKFPATTLKNADLILDFSKHRSDQGDIEYWLRSPFGATKYHRFIDKMRKGLKKSKSIETIQRYLSQKRNGLEKN